MIKHIVLFKLKDREAENIEKAKNTLLDMKGKIKELKHIEVGIDVTNSDRSYDIALLTKFNSVQDLEAYQNNPLHIGVAEYMVSVGESIVVVDYES
ncbi:MAG: Dabb family protein [Methanobacterium sp.]